MNMNAMYTSTRYLRSVEERPPRQSEREGALPRNSESLNRLMSAAVVSQRFCRQLISDPASALALGYNGERFHLTSDEMRLVCSIQASSLRDFAAQLVERMQESVSEMRMPVSWQAENEVRGRIRMERVPVPVVVGHV